MATGKLTISVAAIALMTAFAAPGELPFIPSAEAANAVDLALDTQERGGREGRRGGGSESRGQRGGGGQESRGQRGGGGREGGWQGRQQSQQSAPQQRPSHQSAPQQRPQQQQAPQRQQWTSQREATQRPQQQGQPSRPGGQPAIAPQQAVAQQSQPQRQWQNRGDSDRRAQFQQRREQTQSQQGRPDRRDWQDRRQAQQQPQSRPDRRDWQDRRQAQQQQRPQGQWQNRPQHHARPNYRHQHYNVRYSRSNAVRAPVVYHNHYYVNRYGRRNVRWTPPVRIVHHHIHYSGWTYHPRWHSSYARHNFYYTDGLCRPSGGSVAAGALVGALLGAAISDGDAGALLAGGLIGGTLGAALSDCDRGQYHYATHYAFSTGNPYYWHNPYSGVRGVVYARDYHNWSNQRCRWGDAEIFLPNGEVAYDRVRMCQDQYGYWQVARVQ